MQTLRPAKDRGHVRTSWLDSRHSFSFGHYHDPQWMGFGPLRVINEDRVAPDAGFPPHRHANMEILSWVLEGALAHRDSSGGAGVIRAGEWQWMSAGHGVEHSEYNASDTEPVHFLQVWIQPDRVNAQPAHAQRAFDAADRRGHWVTFASPDGADGSLAIRQQAWLRGAMLDEKQAIALPLRSARRHWLQCVRGAVEVDGERLAAGDAIAWSEEDGEQTIIGADVGGSEVLLFDLPP